MYQLKILLQPLHHTLLREHPVEESYGTLLKYQYLLLGNLEYSKLIGNLLLEANIWIICTCKRHHLGPSLMSGVPLQRPWAGSTGARRT